MKKYLLAILVMSAGFCSDAQILCINCYRQNLPVSTALTNLVVNGSFETGLCSNTTFDCFCPNSSYYSCDIPNWTCSGGGTSSYPHIVDVSWTVIPDGNNSCYLGNWYCQICSPTADDTSCQVNQGCTVTGIPAGFPQGDPSYGGTTGLSVSQLVTGLTAGNVYVLEFWCGGEDGGGYFVQDGIFGMDLGFGTVMLRNPTTDPLGTGLRYIVQFVANNSFQMLKFTNWGHKCSTCTEVILDDIKIYPISELSSIIPACAVGIENIDRADVIISLNDQTHQLTVNTGIQKSLNISIYNALAEKLIGRDFIGESEINVGSLPKGIYIYEINDGNRRISRNKIIIM